MLTLFLFFFLFVDISFCRDDIKFKPKRGFYTSPFDLELTIDSDFGISEKPIVIRYTLTTFGLNDSLTTIANTMHPSVVPNIGFQNNGIANCATYPDEKMGLVYKDPFTIKETTIVTAIAFRVENDKLIATKLLTHVCFLLLLFLEYKDALDYFFSFSHFSSNINEIFVDFIEKKEKIQTILNASFLLFLLILILF